MNRLRVAVVLVLLLATLALAAAPVRATPFTGSVFAFSPLVTAGFECDTQCEIVLKGQGFAAPFGTVLVEELFIYTPGTCAPPVVVDVLVRTNPPADDDGFGSYLAVPPGFTVCAATDGTVTAYNGPLTINLFGSSFAGGSGTLQVDGGGGFALILANLTVGGPGCAAVPPTPTIPNPAQLPQLPPSKPTC